ncbi:hypothetical protein BKA81DRAFT_14679 [Phyllosticta paracitricarpa]
MRVGEAWQRFCFASSSTWLSVLVSSLSAACRTAPFGGKLLCRLADSPRVPVCMWRRGDGVKFSMRDGEYAKQRGGGGGGGGEVKRDGVSMGQTDRRTNRHTTEDTQHSSPVCSSRLCAASLLWRHSRERKRNEKSGDVTRGNARLGKTETFFFLQHVSRPSEMLGLVSLPTTYPGTHRLLLICCLSTH